MKDLAFCSYVGLILRLTALSSIALIFIISAMEFSFLFPFFLLLPGTSYFVVTQSWVSGSLFLLHFCPPISWKLSNVTPSRKKNERISLRWFWHPPLLQWKTPLYLLIPKSLHEGYSSSQWARALWQWFWYWIWVSWTKCFIMKCYCN